MSQSNENIAENTDIELWREPQEDGTVDYYSNSIHVTKQNNLGINVGGYVIVQSLKSWHDLAKAAVAGEGTVGNPWPHSRACGWQNHDHGSACSSNCPTCAGTAALLPRLRPSEGDGTDAQFKAGEEPMNDEDYKAKVYAIVAKKHEMHWYMLGRWLFPANAVHLWRMRHKDYRDTMKFPGVEVDEALLSEDGSVYDTGAMPIKDNNSNESKENK